MTRKQQQQRPASRSMVRLLAVALVLLHTLVASASVNPNTESLSLNSESTPESGFRLKFLQKPAATDKGELYLRHRDNEEDSNASGSSASGGLRYRRENGPGGGKVITTNWGTYEEQAPVVIESASRAIDPATDGDEPIFSDEVQSREGTDEYGSPAGVGSISYEEYEDGRFEEGRQFYPSRGGGYGGAEQEQEQPDGYYRQKYFATTPRNGELNLGEQSKEGAAPPERPRYPNRYRTVPQPKEDEEESQGIMGFVQKAKTFYDIFRAMNSAWKTIEDRYRKNGQGIFLGDEPQVNETTTAAAVTSTEKAVPIGKTTKSPRLKNKKRKTTTTTKAPEIVVDDEEEEEEVEREGETDSAEQQAKDEYRSRRSSVDGPATTNSPQTESSSDSELASESDLDSSESESESESVSTPSTAVAEGRYIKGDPLKGYYDFVITEGSYKFWAAFQVGTAILIIYSTFAAIYYSKVNPLVSDYDYIDYLGGGRSLSDDSDFVDDTPAAVADATDDATTNTDGSKKAAAASGKGAAPEGTPRNQRRQQQSSVAGWFDWLPHAGHTLRFILEAIDKGYTEE